MSLGRPQYERRRWLAASTVLPPLATALGALPRAYAAGAKLPAAVRSLDAAAMTLFDAAEAGNWAAASAALERAKVAAKGVAGLEVAYVDPSGEVANYFEAQNSLNADLIEAGTALSVQDKRWLVNAADRIASRAGELSRPFAMGENAAAPRVDTLLFLARRMRTALVWHDDDGLRNARDDFKRFWASQRAEFASRSPDQVRALEQLLTRLAASSTSADVKALYTAILGLRDPAR